MASLTIDRVSKVFGKDSVVDDVSIDVADGEFIVLVGPSGCGKSTTLRMIAGLESVDRGTIRIGDMEVNEAHPADRNVAMVFQSYALYPHMNVFDNISYGLKRRGVPKAEIAQRVSDVAALLKLQTMLDRRPGQLSGGQRQRVALGRAIVRKPAVFLMDEPLSNLDAKLRVEMRGELTRLHADLGVTTVYVTHDQVEAMTMGQRVVVMNEGRIEQFGPPLEVYRTPASLFVARFLGLPEINIFDGVLSQEDGHAVFRSGALAFRFPAGVSATEHGAMLMGLRPQDMHGSVGGSDDELAEAGVTSVEHHGPESFASVDLGGMPVTVRVTPGAPVSIGSSLSVSARLSHPHFFSKSTGRRLKATAVGKDSDPA